MSGLADPGWDWPEHPLLNARTGPPILETRVTRTIRAPIEATFAHLFGSEPHLRLDLHRDHVKAYRIHHKTDTTLEYEYVFEAYGARNWGKAVEVGQAPHRIDVEVIEGPLVGHTITTLLEPDGDGTRVTQVNRVWPGRSDLMVRLMGNSLKGRLEALAGVHLEQHRRDLEGGDRFQDRFSKEHQESLQSKKVGFVRDLLHTGRAITLPIILLPLLAAAALAAGQDTFSPLALVLTLLGGGTSLMAANLLNDLWDFRGGADQAARAVPGAIETGSGAFVEGRWSLRKGWAMTALLAAIALGSGVALALLTTPLVLALAAAGAFIAYVYVGPPFPLAYKGRGLGELAIFVAFGVLPVTGGVLAHGGAVDAATWWTAGVFGLTSVLVLYHHHFLHWMADRAAGKGSPVALLGPRRGAGVGMLLAVATSALVVAAGWQALPWGVALAGLGPLLVIPAARTVRRDDGPPARSRLAAAAFGAMFLTGTSFVVLLWTL